VGATAADKYVGGIGCETLNRRGNTPDGQCAKSCLHICRRDACNSRCLKPFEVEVFESCALGWCRLEIRIGEETGRGGVRVLLHSLAFGTLRPLVDRNPKSVITPKQMDMTLDVMSHSLVYWTQGLVSRRLMGDGGRIYAMTSSGGDRVSPFYGPVSAAKASLESHCRQLALELAPLGITANAIRAGVTDTPALRKIPGHDRMIEIAREINPHGRLTTPEDIGRCLVALSRPETAWMTGNVLRVDGGEDVVGAGLSSGPDTVAGVSGGGS